MKVNNGPVGGIEESPRVILKNGEESSIVRLKEIEFSSPYYIFTAEKDDCGQQTEKYYVPIKVYEEEGAGLQIGDFFRCNFKKVNICGKEGCKKVTKIKPLPEDKILGDFEYPHGNEEQKVKEPEEEEELEI